MLRNYLTVALRNLFRQKVYSFVNIAGLAIGIATCVLILSFVRFELSYDTYHEKADRIYRVAHERIAADGQAMPTATSQQPLAPALRVEFPEVVQTVKFGRGSSVIFHENNRFQEPIFFGDASVFDVFDFPMIEGDRHTALQAPYSVVLTEKAARKYFGTKDPMGQVLTFVTPVVQQHYTVTGIIREIPRNSHFRFEILASYESLHESGTGAILKNWLSNPVLYTYVLLPKGYSPQELEDKFPAFVKKYMGEALAARGMGVRFFLQPITRIHLYSHLSHEIEPNSDIVHVYIFAALACFVLLIACINFMNLSTARSAARAKEVGIRKVVGAYRLQLIRQFIGESALLAFIALLFAVSLVELSLPFFNRLIGQQLVVEYTSISAILGLAGVALVTGIVAGSYPAFFLSAFQPVTVLKGARHAGLQTSRIRQLLVVVQFAISIALITGTSVIYAQMAYVKDKDLGFERANVISMPLFSRQRGLRAKYESIKADFLQSPDLLSCTLSSHVPVPTRSTVFPLIRRSVHPEGVQGEMQVPGYAVDHDFIKTLGIEIIEGRDFSKDFTTDESEAVVVNETAVVHFGWSSPKEAIGKELVLIFRDSRPRTVIGVVKDFHVQSLYQQIEPMFLHILPSGGNYLLVRVRPNRSSDALNFLKEKWETYVPYSPFEYAFLDDYFERQYRADEQRGKMLGGLTALAICIACLGLFGLASYIAEQRTKEVGIRKVLGASVANIVLLFTKDFVKPVILANLLAWPVAYYAMSGWLHNFAYRIDLSIGFFILSGMLTLIIALLTVGWQAVRTAGANLVDSLRSE
ncbi:MAG: FtsX-like permease family protein [Gemmatimonadetes bacterium]|nr:FtsX-like permease family protein [Gemmatimonadota bacterium]MYF74685.1 FtsX-like permease family protein [Gemmatimonadota bacterium]MYK54543.1 FtsX-like permease family protein [Gemmatimonadota bacterium]